MPKRKAVPSADDETLALVRERLLGGASQVTGQLLAEDGPVGEPARMHNGEGVFHVYAVADRDVTVTGVRLTAVAEHAADDDSEPRTVSVEVPVRRRTFPAGGTAHAAVPNVEGLSGEPPWLPDAAPAETTEV